MSYFHMDHADWARRNNAAGKHNRGISAKRSGRKATRGYAAAPEELTLFQQQAMDILGIVGGGIYNSPINWETVDWDFGRGICVVWHGGLATYDFNKLTLLVLLCHEARIRCEIRPSSHSTLRIAMWPRQQLGNMTQRHPNIDEAVQSFREQLPADHRVSRNDASAGA